MRHGSGGASDRPPPPARRSPWRRLNYQAHLWLGLLTAVFVVVVSLTGIILNHKRAFGIMNEPAHKPGAPLDAALPLSRLVALSIAAFNHPDYASEKGINRMDFRPRQGYIKVRFHDPNTTEVILDVFTGKTLSVAPRGDVFMEHLHSGEIFGPNGVLLSDVTAVALIILTGSGVYIYLYPLLSRRARAKRRQQQEHAAP